MKRDEATKRMIELIKTVIKWHELKSQEKEQYQKYVIDVLKRRKNG